MQPQRRLHFVARPAKVKPQMGSTWVAGSIPSTSKAADDEDDVGEHRVRVDVDVVGVGVGVAGRDVAGHGADGDELDAAGEAAKSAGLAVP